MSRKRDKKHVINFWNKYGKGSLNLTTISNCCFYMESKGVHYKSPEWNMMPQEEQERGQF